MVSPVDDPFPGLEFGETLAIIYDTGITNFFASPVNYI
jgi:hypothetical protein